MGIKLKQFIQEEIKSILHEDVSSNVSDAIDSLKWMATDAIPNVTGISKQDSIKLVRAVNDLNKTFKKILRGRLSI